MSVEKVMLEIVFPDGWGEGAAFGAFDQVVGGGACVGVFGCCREADVHEEGAARILEVNLHRSLLSLLLRQIYRAPPWPQAETTWHQHPRDRRVGEDVHGAVHKSLRTFTEVKGIWTAGASRRIEDIAPCCSTIAIAQEASCTCNKGMLAVDQSGGLIILIGTGC